ncbi:MAG TPA: hypothetical protein VKA27_11805 [Sunxiuqinia sp.]|nr:hypothetical protein [Sunxiuqinia sp.]
MEKAYKNTGYFMLLLVLLVAIGFYQSYFSQFPDFKENTTALSHSRVAMFDHFHAALASIWILFLIGQPLLIRYRRFKIHRLTGKISYLVFPLLILSFIVLIVRILHAEHPILAYMPLSDGILLILFYSLAIYNRKNTPKHMRYMIGTATVFFGPTFGRIGNHILGLQPHVTQNLHYAIIYAILIGLILIDKKHGKNFKPYIIIGFAWIINQFLFNVLL